MKIGIDGGGTKTKGVLYQEQRIVDEYIGEMGNPIVDFELAVSNVVQVIDHLLSNNNLQYSDITCISIGMAGAGTVVEKLTEAFSKLIFCHFVVDSDLKMSHIATFKNNDGNLFIAGTGSSLLSRKDGEFIQKGGWGHILGDEGSGYWIGKQILKTYVDYLDFSEEPLDFCELIPALEEIFPDRSAIIRTVYSEPKTEVAKLASLCGTYDANYFLHKLAQQAGKDIARTLLSCNDETIIPVAFEGSVVKKNVAVLNSCVSEIESSQKRLNIIPAKSATESVFYL
jgi:hypothetical protein